MVPLLRRLAVIMFFLWHAAGVGLYAAPDFLLTSPLHRFIRQESGLRSYMLLTSQWQRWDLFAPDPLGIVSEYIVERRTDDEAWQPIARIAYDTLPWWRRATELKMLRRMTSQESHRSIRERYLTEFCVAVPPGTPLRLILHETRIPGHVFPHSVARWRAVRYEWTDRLDVSITCP